MTPHVSNLAGFSLASLEDTEAFERHLKAYVKVRTGFDSLSHFSLRNAREALADDPDAGRIFAALIDLRISIALLETNAMALERAFNSSVPFSEPDSPTVSVERSFQLRMDVHDHSNAFVLRFRSVWDKIMGILILRFAPARYDWFCAAKSKKAAFRKVFQAHPVIPEDFVQRAEEIIQSFDDRLRTAEAHGAGVLRKSTFTWIDLHDSPPMTLFGYWNYFNEVAHLVGAVFDSEVAQARAAEPGARDAA